MSELASTLESLRRDPLSSGAFALLPSDCGSITDVAGHMECLQAKLIHGINPWQTLIFLGEHYLATGKPGVAYFCFLSSLDIRPSQPDIVARALELEAIAAPPALVNEFPDRCAISVIMPTYNRPEELREAVSSVLEQTFEDFELIVVNDGGTDVADILASFGSERIRYLPLTENKGLSGALNAGLRQAQGRYIAYLDDDDVYHSAHLDLLANYLDVHPNIGCVYSDSWRVYGERVNDKFVEVRRDRLVERPNKYDPALLRKCNYISTLNFMYRRLCLNKVGLFREDFPRLMDWEMLQRFIESCEFAQIDAVTGDYRWKSNNMSLNKLDMTFYGNIVHRYYHGPMRLLFGLAASLRNSVSVPPEQFDKACQAFNKHSERYALARAMLPTLLAAGLPASCALYRSMLIEYILYAPLDCLKMLHKHGHLFRVYLALLPLMRNRATRLFTRQH